MINLYAHNDVITSFSITNTAVGPGPTPGAGDSKRGVGLEGSQKRASPPLVVKITSDVEPRTGLRRDVARRMLTATSRKAKLYVSL